MPSAEFKRIIQNLNDLGDHDRDKDQNLFSIFCTAEGIEFSTAKDPVDGGILVKANSSAENVEEHIFSFI